MKRLVLAILMLILSINLALAASSISSDKDNLDFEEVEWAETDSITFEITNDGTEDLTNIQITSTAHSDFEVSINPDSFNLTVGESKTITVDMKLDDDPDDDSGNRTFGNIEITNDQSADLTIPMQITAPERLELIELDVKVGSESDSDLEDGDKIDKKAKPGDSVEFSLELENLFDSDDDDYVIEDIEIEIVIKDIDDGNNVKKKPIRFQISAGDKKTEKLTLEIPEIVVDDTYDVTITIEADNAENNDKYKIEWTLQLEVEKKKHDVQITKYELLPSTLPCNILQTQAVIGIRNLGRIEEDEVVIELKNSDLNINEKIRNIKLGKDYDSDAKDEKEILILLDQEFAVEGSYPITLNVYFDNDKLDDQKTIDLKINACAETEEPPEEEPEVVEEPVVNETINQTSNVTIAEPEEEKTNFGFIIALIGLFVLIAAIAAVIIFIVIKK